MYHRRQAGRRSRPVGLLVALLSAIAVGGLSQASGQVEDGPPLLRQEGPELEPIHLEQVADDWPAAYDPVIPAGAVPEAVEVPPLQDLPALVPDFSFDPNALESVQELVPIQPPMDGENLPPPLIDPLTSEPIPGSESVDSFPGIVPNEPLPFEMGGGPLPHPNLFFGPPPCTTCGDGHVGACIPGRDACYPPAAHTFVGRFFSHLYESLCCPDPCYQPRWIPEANAGFFVDYARPQTLTRFRYDYAHNMAFPDRSEFFWASGRPQVENGQFNFRGPGPRPRDLVLRDGRNLQNVIAGPGLINVHQINLYQEVAAERASFFINLPYRSHNSRFYPHQAGFADLDLGTKSMLLDTELLALTFQFRTYLPTGNAAKGLGTGHVSLEPSLLGTLKLASETYLQAQLAQWIPIGGSQGAEGGVLLYNFAFNQVLYRFTPNTPLIGTFDMFGATFQDGVYFDPFIGLIDPERALRRSTGGTYFNVGPGLRLSVCDILDIGSSITFPISKNQFGEPLLRVEMRLIY